MQVIKKYANRKLYHTNRKQYITLEGIARLVQQGDAVQVLDNETGDDITAMILTQVVLQSRGRDGGALSANVLTGLLQVGGDTISSIRRTLFASLGGSEQIDAEIVYRLNRLVCLDALTATEATRMQTLLLRRDLGRDPAAPDALDVPSQNDLSRLNHQVDELSNIVEQLLEQMKQPASS